MATDDAVRVPDSELEFGPDLVMRHRGEPLTGISYAVEPSGARCELSYRQGLQHGPTREWDSAGVLRVEERWQDNARHGVTRTFDDAGALVSEQWWDRDRRVPPPPS